MTHSWAPHVASPRGLLSCPAASALLFVALLGAAAARADQSPAGSLLVRAAPGIRISIDGKLAGVTTKEQGGLNVPQISAGQHQVTVQRAGFRSKSFAIVIQPSTSTELEVGKLVVRRRIRRKAAEEPVDMTVSSPPMVLDDTDTPGSGNWEVNVVFDGDLSGDGNSYEVPLIDINYGVGEDVQLTYEVPYGVIRATELDEAGNAHSLKGHGIGDTTVGVKYRFYDDEESSLSLAVDPQLELRTPGSRSLEGGGAAEGGTTLLIPFLVTKELKRIAITADAAVEKATGDSNPTFLAGVGAGRRLTDRLAILGELVARDLNSSDRRLLIDVGLRQKLSDLHAVVAAAGFDVQTAGQGRRHRYLTIGYQRFIGSR